MPSLLMIPGRWPIRNSTSASVLNLPTLNRIDPRAWVGLSPIAFNTCDGSSEPDAQADPLDAQIPN